MNRDKHFDPLSDRRGLAAALVPRIPSTTTVPTKSKAVPVDDTQGTVDFETNQVPLESISIPTLICTSRAGRGSIKITNLSTVDIWIGKSNKLTQTNGDLLPAGRGQWITLPTQSSVWALASTLASGVPSVSFSEVF